jgi:transcriptional regulator with XRE-family HTH domain
MSAPGSAASESFGRRLRRERERRQIALASIADNTKISLSLFEDLERDNPSRWPSGIFRRSFIRAYAEAIGLDPDETAREFLERFPDLNDPDRAAGGPPAHASTLRLTLAVTRPWFSCGPVLRSAVRRSAAIACDLAVLGAVTGGLYLVLGELWRPLAFALVGYYAGGIFFLGNTPGVCLCAPRNGPPVDPDESETQTETWRRLRASASEAFHGPAQWTEAAPHDRVSDRRIGPATIS